MKKMFLVAGLLGVASFSLGAPNKIQMVTYFPVPYVAYSKVTPQKQLDVGLTSSCAMNLGCAESGYSLRAAAANLNKGRLDLNSASAVQSSNVTVGSGYGAANVDFAQNLRIGSLDRGYSLETNRMEVDSLTLFASHMKSGGALFPDCKAKSGSETVSWQKVKLKNNEEVYLMCGSPTAAAASCSDAAYKLAHKSECCPSAPKTDGDCWSTSWDTINWREDAAGGNGMNCGSPYWMSGPCDSAGSCTVGETCYEAEWTGQSNCSNLGSECCVREAEYECVQSKNGWK